MWWIVRLALDRPYTFIVLAIALLIFGTLTIVRTPKDIFPVVGIPIVATIWSYAGLPPDEMANRITAPLRARADHHCQRYRAYRIPVLHRHRPRQNFLPAGGEDRDGAVADHRHRADHAAQFAARHHAAFHYELQRLERTDHPAGPVQSELSEQEMFDLGQNFIRTQLATVQGAALPRPMAGRCGRYKSIWMRSRCRRTAFRRKTSMPPSARRT